MLATIKELHDGVLLRIAATPRPRHLLGPVARAEAAKIAQLQPGEWRFVEAATYHGASYIPGG